MNREQRRKYNKIHGTHYTANEFKLAEIYQRLQAGNLSVKELEDVKLNNDFIHIDNEDLVPEDTEVMLNYNYIKNRPVKLLEKYEQFITDNKDKVMHITRENASDALVCLKEDPDNIWQFDVYSDLLYKNRDGQWVDLVQIEEMLRDEDEKDLNNQNN